MLTQNVAVCVSPELVVNVICQAGPNPGLTCDTNIKNLLNLYIKLPFLQLTPPPSHTELKRQYRSKEEEKIKQVEHCLCIILKSLTH